jgi:pimeloyl-ACP methyl ester carboxylesterase
VRALLGSFLYFPERELAATPADAGLTYRDLEFSTADGERLHGWWVEARAERVGHLLLCHGNGGNIGDRVLHAELLTAVGFDVVLFDYRGYGRSTGKTDEAGTYRDARAARECLLAQPAVDADRVVYLGESLGAAVAVELATEHPPAGLVLLSAFASVRAMARAQYKVIPAPLVPDVYPSLDRIGDLHVPLLVIHGDRDEIVPFQQSQELFDASPGPKRMRAVPGVGHNDILDRAGRDLAADIADWASGL